MQIFLAAILFIVAIALFISKRLIKNDDLERAANIGSLIAAIAALIVLAFYTSSPTSKENQRTPIPPEFLTPINSSIVSTEISTATPTYISTSTIDLTPTATYSEAIVTMSNFYSWINNAKTPKDLINSWNLETSGPNGFQCREPSACDFKSFSDWWWSWKAQYNLYDCGSNIVEVELNLYRRDPTQGTKLHPSDLRYELVDVGGELKIDRGQDDSNIPDYGCELEISISR